MKWEKSCGAVIFKKNNNSVKVLLLRHRAGHWSFSKGHVEKDESEVDTAIRELKEEVNLDISINNDFRKSICYNVKDNVRKEVIYFLCFIDDISNIKIDNKEIIDMGWYSIEDAFLKLTYNEDKEVLKEASNYIKYNL